MHNELKRISGPVLGFLSGFTLFASTAHAESVWAIRIHEQVQYTSFGYGASVRGGYRFSSKDSLSLVLRPTYTRYDYRDGAALAVHAGISYRRMLPWTPYGVATFAGTTLGLGFYTACVWPERCGGSGPSLGGEIGAKKYVSPWLKVTSAWQLDAQSGWIAGGDIVPMFTWSFGLEY